VDEAMTSLGIIDISPGSIRIFLILVLSMVWFYLLNVQLWSDDE
jgi:hypothetical protein